MRVLVTGASGFIGRHLVPALAAADMTVTAAARDPAVLPPSWKARDASGSGQVRTAAQPSLGALGGQDQSDGARDAWRAIIEGQDVVVHLAGIAHVGTGVPEADVMAVNACGPGELALLCAATGVHFIHFSSVKAQTDAVSPQLITEDDPPAPAELYGRAKLRGEQLIAQAGGSYTIMRPVLVYGDGVKGNMAALRRLAASPLPLPIGGLTARRSLLGISNLCDVVVWAVQERAGASSNAVFLLADADPMTVPAMIAAMRAGLGRSARLVTVPQGALRQVARLAGKQAAFERISGPLVVSTARLKAAGWTAPVHVADGLARFAAQSTSPA